MHTIVLPKENEPDVEELPKEVREGLDFVLVSTIDDVLDAALDGRRGAQPLRPAEARRHAAMPA